jgi:hypothetical protein
MGHHRLFYQDAKTVRNQLNEAMDLAASIHQWENRLVVLLHGIDRRRYFVRYGFKSLTTFCERALRFSRTQTQRIVTRVRRYEPTAQIADADTTNCDSGATL